MLIHPPTQKLVLNLRAPERVTTVIPTAKLLKHGEKTFTVVPHSLDETRVLRNLGFDVPSPIEHYYKWSGPYTPFKAQLETASFLTIHPKAFVLNDMGTGKTLAALWAFDYLKSIGLANKMLVISPLSTLEHTWGDEIFRHFPHFNVSTLYGAKAKRLKMLEVDADIYLINHDGILTIKDELIARTDIDTLVIDEIATFRNARTERWKTLKKISAGRERLWGLTGTPTPNLPSDAWAQCRIISPEKVPTYFGQFRDSVLKQVGPFQRVVRDGAAEIVAAAMQPSIRFSRDECIDLPECIYVERHVPMHVAQVKAYREMATRLKMEFEEQQVIAVNDAVKAQKLVQIACGVAYGADGHEVVLPNDPRIAVVREVIDEAGTKVIVFCPFKAVMRRIVEQLREDYHVEAINGETPKAERDRIFNAFQHTDQIKVLVAQPAAMSHGLTLTAASTVVWYAPITSNEIFQQANARITRAGQKHKQLIVCVEGSEAERKIYHRLKKKQSLQGLLLDIVA